MLKLKPASGGGDFLHRGEHFLVQNEIQFAAAVAFAWRKRTKSRFAGAPIASRYAEGRPPRRFCRRVPCFPALPPGCPNYSVQSPVSYSTIQIKFRAARCRPVASGPSRRWAFCLLLWVFQSSFHPLDCITGRIKRQKAYGVWRKNCRTLLLALLIEPPGRIDQGRAFRVRPGSPRIPLRRIASWHM